MNSQIFYKCILSDRKKEQCINMQNINHNSSKKKQYDEENKIKINDFLFDNELKMSKEIKKIPFYYNSENKIDIDFNGIQQPVIILSIKNTSDYFVTLYHGTNKNHPSSKHISFKSSVSDISSYTGDTLFIDAVASNKKYLWGVIKSIISILSMKMYHLLFIPHKKQRKLEMMLQRIKHSKII